MSTDTCGVWACGVGLVTANQEQDPFAEGRIGVDSVSSFLELSVRSMNIEVDTSMLLTFLSSCKVASIVNHTCHCISESNIL